MPVKGIEAKTSRTAEWTCMCRAISSLEKSPFYKSDDRLANHPFALFSDAADSHPVCRKADAQDFRGQRDYGFEVSDHRCAQELEALYFQDTDGRRVGRINETHCIISASKPQA